MTILIYGLGRSGLAALELVRRQGHEAIAYDQKGSAEDRDRVRDAGAAWTDAPATAAVQLCIAAPGVPIDHPDLVALRQSGVEVIGEVEWVYRTIPGTYLGVTGTAGKGTVTRWLADALVAGGIATEVGGNFDPALAAVARPGGTYVVEMSSFQLERIDRFRPQVAVVLNLGEDHLDRHRTVAAYHAAKQRLVGGLRSSETFVFNADDEVVRGWAEASAATCVGFSLQRESDAWLDGHTLVLHGEPLVDRTELGVPGSHQVANALAVALAATAMGVDRNSVATALRDFTGLPGRHVVIAELDGLRFVDDSIATRELAVRAALEAADAPIVWILGGHDKGARPERLTDLVQERVSLIVAIGACGPTYARELKHAAPHVVCSDADGPTAMGCAVKTALEHLRSHHGSRGTVLLAPLASSFDQFHDYVHRSRAFADAVAQEVTWTASS